MSSTIPPADPNDTKVPQIIGVCSFLLVIAPLATALRIYARHVAKQDLWWDDWFCIIGLPFALLPSIFDLIQLRNGFGVHIQFVTSMDKIVNYGYLLYILLLFYNLGLLFFKLSCLAFYVRVFPIIRWLRIAAWVLGGLIIAWAVANEFVLIFRCHPINLAWLGDAAMQAESCIPESTVFIAQSIPTIFFDVVILSMPIKLVWGLQMKLSQRLSVIGIFLLGFLVTLISIVRLVSTVISTDEDLTYGYVNLGMWSAGEPIVGLVCCSLLTFGPLLKKWSTKLGLTKAASSDNYYRPGNVSAVKSKRGYLKQRHSDQFELREGYAVAAGSSDGEERFEGKDDSRHIYVRREITVEHS